MEKQSFASIIGEITSSLKDLVQSEIHLARVEMREATNNATRHAAQAAMFGFLAALGILPLLAFFVIGLGDLLGGNYWLSSLIVALVCIVVGGGFAFRAYREITARDYKLPHTRGSINHELRVVNQRVQNAVQTVQSDLTERPATGHNRRTA